MQAAPHRAIDRSHVHFICLSLGIFLSLRHPDRALAGPYSSGLANTTVGAIDPGVPGFVGGVVNPVFQGWATGFSSYLPAANVDPGWDDPTLALGPVSGDIFHIVSLGDLDATQIAAGAQPGRITLSFNRGIANRAGFDFAVFENALGTNSSVFSELAYVEVSSDGSNFARFPARSLTASSPGPYGSIDPTNVHNLAGKHVNAYGNSFGTPFDLTDLAADPKVLGGQVKLNGIKYVRLIDIPGNGAFADSLGDPIYDAWLTFGSGGFDLDAVGVSNPWLRGDASFDGIVDRNDLAIFARHWQQSDVQFSEGDFNFDGRVDIADLRLLAQNWDTGASPAASLSASLSAFGLPVNVPEPGMIAEIVVVFGALLRRRDAR